MAGGPTMRIAELVAGTKLSDIPAEAIRAARDCVLDTVGVALAGQAQPGSQILGRFIRGMGGAPEASVFGADLRTSPWSAALANGTNAAILDYDDDACRPMSHLSGSLVPAALALAEPLGLSGRAVLEAYIVGLEAGCEIGRGVVPGQYFGGRHPTGTLGTMGATAACAKLLGLDAHRTAVALGIAASGAGGIRAAFGTMTKGLHTGLAASGAILAASLAAEGFTARPDIIETTYGYAHTTVKDDSCRLDEIGAGWGAPWYLIDPGNGIKFQPSGSISHCAGQCAREMAIRHDIRPEEIATVVCNATAIGVKISSDPAPSSANEAMYSTPWAVAVALIDRKTGLAQFTDERVKDPAVRALAARVEMRPHPDLAVITDMHDIRAAEVVITLKDGRTFSQFRRRPQGYPEGDPWTDEMLEEKFREAAGLSLPSERVEQALTLLRHLDQLPDVRELASTLRGGAV